MVQFEYSRAICAVLSFTIGANFACRKKESCLWLVHKVEIYFPKIVFGDSKWPNLNVPGSCTPYFWCLILALPS